MNRQLMTWCGTEAAFLQFVTPKVLRRGETRTFYMYRTQTDGVWVWLSSQVADSIVSALQLTFHGSLTLRPRLELVTQKA